MMMFLLTVELLGLGAWPLTRRLFCRLPDGGWGFSKMIGILATMWLVWMLSRYHLVTFTAEHSLTIAVAFAATIWCAQQAFGVGGVIKILKDLKQSFFGSQRNWFMLTSELLFVSFFLLWTDLRSMKPDIFDLEKFMDYGFLLSALKTRYFPPMDHFLSGETINYYYLGQTLGAFLTQLSGVLPGVGYTLQMSNLLALGLAESFSIGAGIFWLASREPSHALTKRSMWVGIFSAIFVMLAGNLHLLFFLPFQGDKYWFPDATRYIPFTIHEYPIYSFIVNDLHGHVSDIPIVILSVAFAFMTFLFHATDKSAWKKPEAIILLIASTFVLGACYIVSSWDLAILLLCYGLVYWSAFTIAWFDAQFEHGRDFISKMFQPAVLLRTVIASTLLVGGAVFFWFPHWVDMKPPAQGIGFVTWAMRSSPHRLIVVWGLQAFFTISYFCYRYKRSRLPAPKVPKGAPKGTLPEPKFRFEFLDALVVISALLILIPEVIYVKDIYPDHPRSNTVFKLYYAAWIFLGIQSAYGLVYLWNNLRHIKPQWDFHYKTIAVILVAGAGYYPFKASDQYIIGGSSALRKGLDGTSFLNEKLPADAKAIQWLNDNVKGQPIIAEGIGTSYSLYARVATFTGFPAVLGWPYHEWLWRGTIDGPIRPMSRLQQKTNQIDSINIRENDIRKLYETLEESEARQIIEKYGIRYVYVGGLEREKYPTLQEGKFQKISTNPVYDQDGVKIYKVR